MSTKNDKNALPSEKTLTRDPFPASNKIYVPGKIFPEIRVAMREIQIEDPTMKSIDGEKSALAVYDTSGPYTDPHISLDVKKGLPQLRRQWILDRGDVEELPSLSSEYGRERAESPKLAQFRFTCQKTFES